MNYPVPSIIAPKLRVLVTNQLVDDLYKAMANEPRIKIDVLHQEGEPHIENSTNVTYVGTMYAYSIDEAYIMCCSNCGGYHIFGVRTLQRGDMFLVHETNSLVYKITECGPEFFMEVL